MAEEVCVWCSNILHNSVLIVLRLWRPFELRMREKNPGRQSREAYRYIICTGELRCVVSYRYHPYCEPLCHPQPVLGSLPTQCAWNSVIVFNRAIIIVALSGISHFLTSVWFWRIWCGVCTTSTRVYSTVVGSYFKSNKTHFMMRPIIMRPVLMDYG